ncbi:MAG TPA: histidine kinase [Solirubrobacteraceae bacterium]|nr:histidine kinase [Solirubrobacteraceae bacterium]
MLALHLPHRRSARLTRPSLLAQVLGVNAALIAATVLTVSLAVDWQGHGAVEHRRSLLLVAALLATVLVNAFVLRRRFEPLERLIEAMEQVDAADPDSRPPLPPGETDEVVRLHQAFEHMLDRLDTERARTASAVLRAQEVERARIARDLHDEANQALTGVLLRLQATAERAPEELRPELRETQRAATQAIEELLRLARELRPAALDDHGLAAALRTKVSDFARQTGVHAELSLDGTDVDALEPEEQIVVYRVVQESLSNVAQHAGAGSVRVAFARERGATVARVQDDGRGFAGGAPAGHGLRGMRERAALAGGSLDVRSAPGGGTTIELRLGERVA